MKTAKKLTAVLLTLAMLLAWIPAGTLAATVTANGTWGDNLTWQLDDAGTLTISGTGEMDAISRPWSADSAWLVYRYDIKKIVIREGVTSIGDLAFLHCAATSVSIPSSVKTIGSDAFCGCGLEELVIPDGVETIDGEAFCSCSNLQKITISGTVKNIDMNAFMDCVSLQEIDLGEGVESIGDNAFSSCGLTSVELPASVKTVGEGVFENCEKLASVTVHSNQITNLETVLRGIASLQKLTINDNNPYYTVKEGVLLSKDEKILLLGLNSGADSLTIQDGVTEIADKAFQDRCPNNIIVPASVSSVGNDAFANDKLCSVTFQGDAPTLSEESFSYARVIAFYPASNTTWLEDNLQNYGGRIIWRPYRECVHSIIKTYAERFCTSMKYTFSCRNCGLSEYVEEEETGRHWFSDWNTETTSEETVCIQSRECECGIVERITINGNTISGEIENSIKWVLDAEGTMTVSGNGAIPVYGENVSRPWAEYLDRICKVVISEGITAVKGNAFAGCEELSEVQLPLSLTELASDAFICCPKLLQLTIPASVQKIGNAIYDYGPNERNCFTAYVYAGSVAEAYYKNHQGYFGTPYEIIEHTHNYEVKQHTAATCTEDGEDVSQCSCGMTTTTTIYAEGHHWKWTVTTPSTADTTGVRARSCSNCDEKEVESIPYLNAFGDVPSNQYYYMPVLWAANQKIVYGTSKTSFSPEDTCTRGQVVTFLHRYAGKPVPAADTCAFTDVEASMYYYKPVLWAAENKIVYGTSKTSFAPEAPVTRGQFVTFLWRMAGKPEPTTTATAFQDIVEGTYYYKAVLWATENKIVYGTSKTSFAPEDLCTRGQVVTFLYRYANGL